MTTSEATLGPCERCQQTRPLAEYVPGHWGHGGYEPALLNCRWCMATESDKPQLLLCVDCTELEAAEESGRPRTSGEQQIADFFRCGAELDEQRRAS
jgi:hypothetical protein